jgi:hypothetical protein
LSEFLIVGSDPKGDVVLLVDPFRLHKQYWASLEGFTASNRGRRWSLRDGVETIGRAGTRKNQWTRALSQASSIRWRSDSGGQQLLRFKLREGK